MPRSADPSTPPVRIDGFDELHLIGRGGFSYVFSARQRDFNRRVALKVLTFGLSDERERRSFERECRAMGLASQHPHIVTVFNAAFTSTKQPCIVMELYSGGTMGDRQQRDGPLPIGDVLEIGVKISGALQTAHDRGLLHRDIKPQNLFISEFGEPALGDFGISTLDDERSISGGAGLTVHYAPPEVLEGSPATPSSDVYSLAATLYTLVEGVRPFGAAEGTKQSIGELARRIMLEAPPRSKRAPRALAELLSRTMAKRPEDRPASAAAFGEELRRIQGELGMSVTTLPLASSPSPSPSLAPSPSPPLADALAPPTPTRTPPAVAPAAEAGETVTVARPVAEPAPPPPPDGQPPTTRRLLLGTAAGVVCLLAVALALLVLGRGDDADDVDPTTPTGPASTQVLPIALPAPVGITAIRTGASVTVSWAAVGEAGSGIEYVVDLKAGDVTSPRTDQLRVTFADIPAELQACFTVTAIAPDGAIGLESDLKCA